MVVLSLCYSLLHLYVASSTDVKGTYWRVKGILQTVPASFRIWKISPYFRGVVMSIAEKNMAVLSIGLV